MKKILTTTLLLIGISGATVFISSCQQKSSSTSALAEKVIWTCPMHPQYVSDKPGECPICHMTLVIKEKKDDEQKNSAASDVRINTAQEKLIGVKTVEAQRVALKKTLNVQGRVVTDSELYNALFEFQQASEGKTSLANISQERLSRMGISHDFAVEVISNPEKMKALLPGTNQWAWVYAEIYQSETARVKLGQRLEVTSSSFPSKKWTGTIQSIDTALNPETRTLKVRAILENKNTELRPEMYLDVNIHMDLGTRLAIPTEAIFDSGKEKKVFVKVGEGHYEPRHVETGVQADSMTEITKGISSGDVVVNSSNFLIDSESKLNSAF